jgi:hypothetical protein
MKLLYGQAGRIGAAKHFPLTVFNKVPVSVVEHNISSQNPSRNVLLKTLRLSDH